MKDGVDDVPVNDPYGDYWVNTSDDKSNSGYYVSPGDPEWGGGQSSFTAGHTEYMGSDSIESIFSASYDHLRVGRVKAVTEQSVTTLASGDRADMARTTGGGTEYYQGDEKLEHRTGNYDFMDEVKPAQEEWERYVGITRVYDSALTANRQQSIKARLLGVDPDDMTGAGGNARSNTAVREVRVA